MAVGVTAVVALGLTIFAMQTRFDFTVLNGALFICLFVLIIFGFLAAIIRNYVSIITNYQRMPSAAKKN